MTGDGYSPAQRRQAARVGGLTTQIRHGQAPAARARSGFMAKFEREVDPDGRLAPEERKRLASLALKRHMALLAIKKHQKQNDRPGGTPSGRHDAA